MCLVAGKHYAHAAELADMVEYLNPIPIIKTRAIKEKKVIRKCKTIVNGSKYG